MSEYTNYIKTLLTEPPRPTKFKIGDKVVFTNDYGVKFSGLRVIGYSVGELYQYGKFIHTDKESYWFPSSEDQLSHEQPN